MQDIEFMVREGHKLLAAKTLETYTNFVEEVGTQSAENQRHLSTFRDNVAYVGQTGNILELSEEGRNNIEHVMRLVTNWIPMVYQPKNPLVAFKLSLDAVCIYAGMTPDELVKKIRLDNTAFGPEAGVTHIHTGGGEYQRTFFMSYTPSMRAYDVIVNAKELWRELQTEQNEIMLLSGVLPVQGYTDFFMSLQQDPNLLKQMMDIGSESHVLDFVNTSEVKQLARQKGVDMASLDKYLSGAVPRMNLLLCYTKGEAYLNQHDIVECSTDLLIKIAGVEASKKTRVGYRLLALTDAMLAPLKPPKTKIHHIGIGFMAYLREIGKVKMAKTPEFEADLAKAYFTPKAS